jgi:L-ascorbate metabolism protein UlaG (beta-lactamase superfamily)
MALRDIPKRGWNLVKRTAVAPVHALDVEHPTPAAWPADALSLSCLGHATTLINLHGTVILTDPALLDRVGFEVGERIVGPKRVLPPALHIEELPALDLVLVSHAHPDHMDVNTLARLPKRATLVVPSRCSDIVASCGFTDVRELATGDTIEIAGARITAVEVVHYGKRHALDRVRGRGYNGYLMAKNGNSVFFGGDTAHAQFAPSVAPNGVDVAVFGIGGYDPFVWNHATPEQAWDMARQLKARWFLPMHWATFMLSDEPIEQPLLRLLAAAGPDVGRIVARTFGQTFTVPVSPPVPRASS